MPSLPSELDFDKDRAGTPDRMNRAMSYLVARIRALESSQPEFTSAVEQLRRLILDRMSEVLIPAYQQVEAIQSNLTAIQERWQDDGFAAAVAAIVLADVDGRFAAAEDVALLAAALAGKSATGHGHAIADVEGLQGALDARASAADTAAALATKASATDPILTGAIYANGSQRGNVTALDALAIDCAAGNYFTKTIAGNATFTVANAPVSRSYGFTLELTHTSGTVTWFAGVQWPNGTAPSLTTGKVHLFVFHTDDGGATWRGAALPNYNS
ncbi:hypothetical protein [Sphingobium cloacae]|uniref:Uncharacterized protein n=1 Tax=Sphingobium cloacae TaxID=120107 RepID=A0A1E1F5I4_9SPHN|nr:hypothetical protein [Sphingobium cloacae]BAV65757.1 hypothetical protein SCLO_1027170 [Sphingobium cloacae]